MLTHVMPLLTNSVCLGANIAQPSPAQALQSLKEGNLRYLAGAATAPRADAARRRETYEKGQNPFAAILGCSDSRVPLETIFNAGIGDLFVVRVAGNVCNNDELASLEYAVDHLDVPVCLVMGHTRCGAVTAVVKGSPLPDSLERLTRNVREAAGAVRAANPDLECAELVEATARENVRRTVDYLLKQSGPVRERVAKGSLAVRGAMYDLATGKVEWLE